MSWQTIVKENNLDVSEVLLSKIGEHFRIDAEFYQLDYVTKLKLLQIKTVSPLKDLGFITDGEHGSPEWDENSGIRYVTAEKIKENFILDNEFKYISEKQFERNKRASLRENDVLIYSVGMNAGLTAKMEKHLLPASIPRSVAVVRPEKINSSYLSIFLNSKYGKFQTERFQAGNAQPVLALNNIQRFLIAIPGVFFQTEIEKNYSTAYKFRILSKQYFIEAEQILLKELGLDKHITSELSTSVRDLSECLQDDRFDAEYWQPEYDEVIKKINSYKLGASTIGSEFKQIKSNFKAEAKQEYKYIEIGDVNVSTGEVDNRTVIAEELPANAKILLGKRQLVTSKVRPNRGATAILDNHDGYIGSGAFVVLQEKQSINLETLMVYLKLQPIKDLLLRYNTGTSYPTIVDADVLNLPIPLIDKKVQEKISELIVVSKRQRLEAKELLEKAKHAVEVFIEKDETEALKIL